jgi:hypothetical protein
MWRKLDGKVYGELFKAKNDERIDDSEYVVFLAKDNAFAAVLPVYRAICLQLGCEPEQIRQIDLLIERVHQWREANPHRKKNPDVAGEKFIDIYGGKVR